MAPDGAAAAVGDYRVKNARPKKIKRTGAELTLTLVPNPDIVAELAKRRARRVRPLIVGFALETDNLVKNAKGKMARKGLDMIVANKHTAAGAASTDAASNSKPRNSVFCLLIMMVDPLH